MNKKTLDVSDTFGVSSLPDDFGVSSIPDDFGFWFSGFFDGEGHFYVGRVGSRYRLAIEIGLRDDDSHVVKRIAKELNCGTIVKKDRTKSGRNSVITFSITKISDLWEIIVPFFEKYPLTSKKAREFEIWKRLVWLKYLSRECRCKCKFRNVFNDVFNSGIEEIRSVRRYK